MHRSTQAETWKTTIPTEGHTSIAMQSYAMLIHVLRLLVFLIGFFLLQKLHLRAACAGDARYKDPATHPSPRGHGQTHSSPANWFGPFEHVYKSFWHILKLKVWTFMVWHNARDIATAFRSHFEYSVQASLPLATPADKPEKAEKDLSNVSTKCLPCCFRRIISSVLACFGLALTCIVIVMQHDACFLPTSASRIADLGSSVRRRNPKISWTSMVRRNSCRFISRYAARLA